MSNGERCDHVVILCIHADRKQQPAVAPIASQVARVKRKHMPTAPQHANCPCRHEEHALEDPIIACSPRCRSEEHTSELQSLMRISYAVFCLKKKKKTQHTEDATR